MNLLLFLLLPALLVFVGFCSAMYILVMFNGALTIESIVEGLYFTLQTITTVGYGNWMPAGVSEGDSRIFLVKVISLPTMIIGATLFIVTVTFLIAVLRDEV